MIWDSYTSIKTYQAKFLVLALVQTSSVLFLLAVWRCCCSFSLQLSLHMFNVFKPCDTPSCWVVDKDLGALYCSQSQTSVGTFQPSQCFELISVFDCSAFQAYEGEGEICVIQTLKYCR